MQSQYCPWIFQKIPSPDSSLIAWSNPSSLIAWSNPSRLWISFQTPYLQAALYLKPNSCFLIKTMKPIVFYITFPDLYAWVDVHSFTFQLPFLTHGCGVLSAIHSRSLHAGFDFQPSCISNALLHPSRFFFSAWSAFVFLLDYYPKHMQLFNIKRKEYFF